MNLIQLKTGFLKLEIVRKFISGASFLLMLRGMEHTNVFVDHIDSYLHKNSGTVEGKECL